MLMNILSGISHNKQFEYVGVLWYNHGTPLWAYFNFIYAGFNLHNSSLAGFHVLI